LGPPAWTGALVRTTPRITGDLDMDDNGTALPSARPPTVSWEGRYLEDFTVRAAVEPSWDARSLKAAGLTAPPSAP
jgi:hypothetical protein